MSGMSAETDSGGVVVNVVPKSGGNVFRGNVALTGVNDNFQSSNLSDELVARGLTSTASVKQIYDVGGGLGGPFKQDTLWFYTAHRWWGSQEKAPNSFYNKTHGTPFFTPDPAARLHGLLRAGPHGSCDLAGVDEAQVHVRRQPPA